MAKDKNSMSEQKQWEYIQKQRRYVDNNIKPLIGIYSGRFVMVYGNRVVDSDTDEIELEKRYYKRLEFDIASSALRTMIPKTLEEHIEEVKRRNEPISLESPESAD